MTTSDVLPYVNPLYGVPVRAEYLDKYGVKAIFIFAGDTLLAWTVCEERPSDKDIADFLRKFMDAVVKKGNEKNSTDDSSFASEQAGL